MHGDDDKVRRLLGLQLVPALLARFTGVSEIEGGVGAVVMMPMEPRLLLLQLLLLGFLVGHQQRVRRRVHCEQNSSHAHTALSLSPEFDCLSGAFLYIYLHRVTFIPTRVAAEVEMPRVFKGGKYVTTTNLDIHKDTKSQMLRMKLCI